MTTESDENVAKQAKDEEIYAAKQYDKHIIRAKDSKLKRLLKHNRKDELEDHAEHLEMYLEKKKAYA